MMAWFGQFIALSDETMTTNAKAFVNSLYGPALKTNSQHVDGFALR